VLRLQSDVITETFRCLRECGADQRECVTYWTGPRDEPDIVDRVEHPRHRASRVGYEVDSAWVTMFFLQLRETARLARAQVHTHPGPAGHSDTDDDFALVPAPGFFSLVIPYFAAGRIGLDGAVLMEVDADGTWARRDPEAVLSW
jgi:hypothetical protein